MLTPYLQAFLVELQRRRQEGVGGSAFVSPGSAIVIETELVALSNALDLFANSLALGPASPGIPPVVGQQTLVGSFQCPYCTGSPVQCTVCHKNL